MIFTSYAAAPGTTIRGFAVLPIASTTTPTTASAVSVFELSVPPRGLFRLKHVGPFSLFHSCPLLTRSVLIFLAFYQVAERGVFSSLAQIRTSLFMNLPDHDAALNRSTVDLKSSSITSILRSASI